MNAVRIGYCFEENPDLPASMKEFALECAAYNNTDVWHYMGRIYIDSLKASRVFRQHLPAGYQMEILRTLTHEQEMAAWTGDGDAEPAPLMIGDRTAIGHVYCVTVY